MSPRNPNPSQVGAATSEIANHRSFFTTLRSIVESNPQFNSRGSALSAVTALGLGLVMASAFWLAIFVPSLSQFCTYIVFLTGFHFMEFFMTALFHPNTLTWSCMSKSIFLCFAQSFLLDHSRAYSMAFLACQAEYWLEFLVFPSLHDNRIISLLGLLLCIVGQIFRTGAMFSAASNFTHQIAVFKRDDHKLVQTGFYSSIVRHPSYFGWFWWSIGTQLLLCNPICTLAYTFASWKFFAERIPYEEEYLAQFFGEEFIKFRNRVPTGIPLIE